jgi:hypothetical protein
MTRAQAFGANPSHQIFNFPDDQMSSDHGSPLQHKPGQTEIDLTDWSLLPVPYATISGGRALPPWKWRINRLRGGAQERKASVKCTASFEAQAAARRIEPQS